MTRKFLTLAAGALLLGMSSMSAMAAGKTIAVSWKTFQEERWKTDEAAIKAVVEAAGDTYVSTDAQGSAAKQASDIEGLISQKVDVIMVVAFDSDAILPSFKAASDAGVKMLSYDVLVEDPNALYVTFDNVGVGRLMAKTMLEKGKSEGDFAFIKGDKGDPNATFLFQGIMEVLKAQMDAGKIKNVCETFTDGWKPDNAQKNMEQCLTSTDNKVDAVMSENDGMASGVVAALDAQGLAGTCLQPLVVDALDVALQGLGPGRHGAIHPGPAIVRAAVVQPIGHGRDLRPRRVRLDAIRPPETGQSTHASAFPQGPARVRRVPVRIFSEVAAMR